MKTVRVPGVNSNPVSGDVLFYNACKGMLDTIDEALEYYIDVMGYPFYEDYADIILWLQEKRKELLDFMQDFKRYDVEL